MNTIGRNMRNSKELKIIGCLFLNIYKDIEPTPISVFCVPNSNPDVIEICWYPFDCANDIVLKKYNDTIRNNFFITKLLPSAHRHIQI